MHNKKSTKFIAFALDIFVFRAILIHINSIPETAPFFSEPIHNFFDRD